jgi:putative transposase
VLQVAPSTYYAAVSRPLSARKQRDEQLKVEIARVHRDNFGAYGIERVWRQLNREGIQVGRDRVHRLMDEMDLEGVVRGKRKPITTMSNEVDTRPDDLVERDFTASAPNALWAADLTYVSTLNGFCYVAFVVDVFSRFIVGWRISRSLHADVALDALEMAIWKRRRHDLAGLVHHSDRGVQYTAIRYTERLEEIGAMRSVGSRGDSYDNAWRSRSTACTKPRFIHRQGASWRSLEHVELATAEWVDWWNHKRLHSALNHVPPLNMRPCTIVLPTLLKRPESKPPSLHWTQSKSNRPTWDFSRGL